MPLELMVKGKGLLINEQDPHLNGSQLKIDQCKKLPSKKVIWTRKRVQEKHSLL
jgi:agmatine/peptidylarginine deiminase